ncbi:MAG: histidine phosphatase family protein [Proteobacteria bacterium]|nr:histidine phosphatase family protein [Pseudomonadota bacterium]
MKHLTLVRHAHAEKHDSDIEDFERRLDKRGRREAEAMAELAHALGLHPDHIVTSPSVRTVSTAKEFARALGFPLQRIRHDDRIYLAERSMLVTILRSTPASCRHVLLVGHNPGVSRLARWLTDDEALGDLVPAAVCALRADLDRWADLDAGLFERVALRYPDDGGPRR